MQQAFALYHVRRQQIPSPHMNDSVNQALRRVVEQSSTPDELTHRVIQSFGETKLAHARQIAAETKGFDWLRQGREAPSADATPARDAEWATLLRVLRETPSLLALLIGALALLLVLLFPPFIVPLPQGMVNNAGFAFIFSPPVQSNLEAIVNTQLLALLAFGIVASTAAFHTVLFRIERATLSGARQ
jgi:hypothetical protein